MDRFIWRDPAGGWPRTKQAGQHQFSRSSFTIEAAWWFPTQKLTGVVELSTEHPSDVGKARQQILDDFPVTRTARPD
jgi:hypothetical protein